MPALTSPPARRGSAPLLHPRLRPLVHPDPRLLHLLDLLALLQADTLHSPPLSRLGTRLRLLRRLIDRAEVEFTRVLAAFERRGGPASEAASSSIAWLIRECHLSGAEANSRL